MKNNRMLKFLTLTFLISWTCWWGEALLVKTTGLTQVDIIPMIIFTIGGFGPTIAACFCLDEKFSLKALFRFVFRRERKTAGYLFLFLFLEIATFVLSSMELNSAISISLIPLIILQAIIIYGGNEELGWRGIMQPIIQEKFSFPIATLIIGVVWAAWHIPLWFIEGNSHQGMSFLLFSVLAILLSYWLAAIYNSTKSVFFCMIMHGITNSLLSIFVIKINWILIVGLLALTALSNWIGIKKTRRSQSF